jgi:hypothetical protein
MVAVPKEVVAPGYIPSTIPVVEPTVAILADELVQMPPVDALLKVVVENWQRTGLPVITGVVHSVDVTVIE